jgi:hypothetical protein
VRPSAGESVAARLGHQLSIELMDAAENGRPRSLRWPRCEHLKHHLARRGRGIEPLLMQKQIHALFLEVLQDAEQVREGSTKPIHRTGSDHIEFPGVHRLHHRFQTGTLVPTLGTTDAGILVNFTNLPPRPIRQESLLISWVFSYRSRKAFSV